jgi:hypothetical protein
VGSLLDGIDNVGGCFDGLLALGVTLVLEVLDDVRQPKMLS